ncbi:MULTISPECIES: glycosyltransferase [Rahnella]|uniref:Glycosyltransferase n=1 Tax=Rahnella laticis TaxID=2787622 RepID=A0ABS0E582_9GAMM|nr:MULTISPECIES: glycosyltransferase [Rahnella]MBF7980257.1 glycosyltransferase [Rahnella laticis]MBF8000484.1 glycosyltransferase [Rahnella sp. LAC-M12]
MVHNRNIFIYAPDIHEGDAVGNHCIGLAKICQRLGYNVHLCAQRYSSQYTEISIIDAVELFDTIKIDDILFVSYSILDSFLDSILELNCPKVCYYHDITPYDLLEKYEPVTASLCREAISQLPKLSLFNKIIATSNFSKLRLAKHVPNIEISVIPPVFKDSGLLNYDKPIVGETYSNFFDLLYVGRIVPHKRIEDVIKAFSLIGCSNTIKYRMFIVGSMPNYDYSKLLFNLARELGVADRITFTGTLTDSELAHRFITADGYFTMSLHEGFCIPVLEAMHFDVPVIVRSGTAADDLLGSFTQNIVSVNDATSVIEALISKQQSHKRYSDRAAEIILQTRDEVWDAIFSIYK